MNSRRRGSWLGAARAGLRDERGSATIEFTIGVLIFATIAAAAADLGAVMAAQARIDGAARDATRTLSLVPRDGDGDFLTAGVDLAVEEYNQRVELAGLDPIDISNDVPDEAVCTDDGSFCHMVQEVPGSEDALGEARHIVSIWTGAEIDTVLAEQFLPESTLDGVALRTGFAQVHFR